MSAFCVPLNKITVNPCVCEAFTFSWPECNIISSEIKLFCPVCLYWVSLIPSIIRLYLVISIAIWVVLQVFRIVRTFHVPILLVSLVVRRNISLVTSKESGLSSRVVIILLNEDSSTLRFEFRLFLASVFEWVSVFMGFGLLTLLPNLTLYPDFGLKGTLVGVWAELLTNID